MFKVNEYFEGKVTSLGFETPEGRATIGVIASGEYEFGTNTVEHMTVVSGKMDVLLPGEAQWVTYNEFETFIVPKDSKFRMKTDSDTAYRCLYR